MFNLIRWTGHLIRMEDVRLPKVLLYEESQHGRCLRHKPMKRFKDVNKNNPRMPSTKDWEETETGGRRCQLWKKWSTKALKHFKIGESKTPALCNQNLTSFTGTLPPERVFDISLFVRSQICQSFEISWQQTLEDSIYKSLSAAIYWELVSILW